jgi:hypothetical protein
MQSAQASEVLSNASSLASVFSQSCALERWIEAKRDELFVEFRLTCLQRRFQFSEEIKDSSLIAVWIFHQVGEEGAERMRLPFCLEQQHRGAVLRADAAVVGEDEVCVEKRSGFVVQACAEDFERRKV